MAVEVKIPSVGESVQEAELVEWYKKDGDYVKQDEVLFVIETDKVTLEVVAETSGVLKILVAEGETVAIGAVVGTIEPAEAAGEAATEPEKPAGEETAEPVAVSQARTAPEAAKPENMMSPPIEIPEKQGPDVSLPGPSVRKMLLEKRIDPAGISGSGPGGRITKGDVLLFLEGASPGPAGETKSDAPPAESLQPQMTAGPPEALEERKAMTPIRKRIAQRLLASKQNTAMLTTFNEIDMSRTMEIRKAYKELFLKKHDISLGFMSFFIKACVEALKEIPEINAFIDGDDIIYHHYQHIGVAIGAERGLVVPVIRHAERLGFAGIEKAIIGFVERIKNNTLQISDLEGGTFTVSNGGVYGSLLSTPILNTPQSGILGMHKIEERPVVHDGEIRIRPMMYVALSYDHRIVDGKGAVTFLKRVKEFVENPERMALEV